jgi:thiosulfate dehydrogenase [quinone] large subunit
MTAEPASSNRNQQVALVLLRTLVGWHFLYEGLVKLWSPGWSAAGTPLPAWTAASYLKASTGPLAPLFQSLGASGLLSWLDTLIPLALVSIGLGLTVGLFTRLAALGALSLLLCFYLAQVPTAGVPQPGAEGAYLLVSKTLIEAAAVFVLVVFRTEEMAGLDLWRRRPALPDSTLGENAA